MREKRASSWLSKTRAPAAAFLKGLQLLPRHLLLVGIPLEIAIGWPIGTHPMLGTKRPHGGLTDAQAERLVERRGQFGVGPVGPVQSTAHWAWLDPRQDG